MNQKSNLQPEPLRKTDRPHQPGVRFSSAVPTLPAGQAAEAPDQATMALTESQTFERLSVLTKLPDAPLPAVVRQLAVIESGTVEAGGKNPGFILTLNDPKDSSLVLAQYRAKDLPALLELIREHLSPKA